MTRNRRFVDSFWESDFNGTLGFDHLCKRIKDGHKTCKDIEDFLKKRAKAEQQYSKLLQNLVKSTDSREESGGLSGSWQEMRQHTEKLAQLHENAYADFSKLSDEIAKFADDQKTMAKQAEDHVKEDQKAKKAAYNKTMELQKVYGTKCREMKQHENQYNVGKQSVTANPKDVEKMKVRAEKSKETMEQADQAYRQAVEVLERCRSSWEHNMADTCESFQRQEEERIAFLRDVLWKCTNVDSRSCIICDDNCELVRQCLESCDVDQDMQDFIDKHMTGSARPAPIVYESYFGDRTSSDIDKSPKSARRNGRLNQPLPPVPPGQQASYSAAAEYSSIYSVAGCGGTMKYRVSRSFSEGVSGITVRRGDVVTMLEPENRKGHVKIQVDSSGRTGLVPRDLLQLAT